MWRNVSWNSTETNLPDGMHKHETGAYFKTPSIQSASSSHSTATGGAPVATIDSTAAGAAASTVASSRAISPEISIDEEPEPEVSIESLSAAATESKKQRNPRLKDSQKQASMMGRSLADVKQPTSTTNSNNNNKSSSQQQPQQHGGFRSRLSSISDALHSQKLTRRLFSSISHQEPSTSSSSQHQQQQQNELRAPIQITTTSIDSPQHQPASNQSSSIITGMEATDEHLFHQYHQLQAARPLTSGSSGRRLSQLFLPQVSNAPTLLGQDPYASNELIPPHLLGLYGQPPLVGGSSTSSSLNHQHRASWADTSLLGRLSNFRPSIDSAAYHSGGQVRHSFDARKYLSLYFYPSLLTPISSTIRSDPTVGRFSIAFISFRASTAAAVVVVVTVVAGSARAD